MDENPVLVERREGYRVITLNRPQRLNAFNEPMQKALAAAVAETENDENCRALLLTGTGRAFSSGQDLSERINASVNREDRWLCERVQRGLASTSYRPGPLSQLEFCMLEFHDLLRSRIPEFSLAAAPQHFA